MMISVDINGCTVDILPVVKGLVSEYDRVKEAVSEKYDAFAVSLGKEDIIAVGLRDELKDDQEIEDIDIVYLHHLGSFGTTDVPAPAFSALIDECNNISVPVLPLDMDEESFSAVYCDLITTFELLKEGRIARKALKKSFDMSSPEAFVISWDIFVNSSKGFRELTRLREKYMANRIKLLARTSERMLAVIEAERIAGIMSILDADGHSDADRRKR
ncbi:MAG: hypothetical protein LBV13_00615 [Methanomassiliicoccaceae archaeon]|jgi:hypothetical protein|nr:hypothetical protein [Methanomassiliicoccaceae archaeon]